MRSATRRRAIFKLRPDMRTQFWNWPRGTSHRLWLGSPPPHKHGLLRVHCIIAFAGRILERIDIDQFYIAAPVVQHAGRLKLLCNKTYTGAPHPKHLCDKFLREVQSIALYENFFTFFCSPYGNRISVIKLNMAQRSDVR